MIFLSLFKVSVIWVSPEVIYVSNTLLNHSHYSSLLYTCISICTIRYISPMLYRLFFFNSEIWSCPRPVCLQGWVIHNNRISSAKTVLYLLSYSHCSLPHSILLSAFLKGFVVVPAPGLYLFVPHHISGKYIILYILVSFFCYRYKSVVVPYKDKEEHKTWYLPDPGNLNFTAIESLETKQNRKKHKTPGSTRLFQTKKACQVSAQQSNKLKILL